MKIKELAYRIIPERAFRQVAGIIIIHMASYYIPKLINMGRTAYNLSCPVDSLIPFTPLFVVFYVLAFLQWGVYYLILAREEENVMRRYLTAGAISKIVCMAVFIVIPTAIERPEIQQGGVFSFCCRVVYSFDEPTNLFPSMHCLESWLCMRLALEEHKRGRVPELARSIVRGYSGEMILCVNRKQWKEQSGDFIRIKRSEIDSLLEKIFSRRQWRLDERIESVTDEVAEAAEDEGAFFVRVHTLRTSLLSILVVLSTLFVKQHYFVDAVAAIILAELSLLTASILEKNRK